MAWVEVAVDAPLFRTFTYRLDDGEEDPTGSLVRAPFGRTNKIGVVLGLAMPDAGPDAERIKRAERIPGLPRLPEEWLALVRFAADYYRYPLGQAIAFALPPLLREGRLPRRPARMPAREEAVPVPLLNPAQAAAVAAIAGAASYRCFLLHGVTGSGKTEVYLAALAATLERGQQALLLVPEIALTPQLAARVSARFPERRIVIATSGVAAASRAHAFLEALTGRADIVLGTRLAVFMPMPRLGLIIVDEEHDPSFKQQEGFFFSARDLAIWRAHRRGVPIVLGSATPSLESFFHAQRGRYCLLTLPERAGPASLPVIRLLDTRATKLIDGLSPALLDALSVNLARRQQSLVFLNRRGYAPVLACPACGWISDCTRCAAHLVVHLAEKAMICHHCGLKRPIPRACPQCGNLDLAPCGRGTQRLEARLKAVFPGARVLRIDRDSATTPKKWQSMLDEIHTGGADILVGTQMLAKGHDFPALTLVGVVGADASLYAADFRAPERLFAQLMQVAGRAGRRAEPGEVLIQTEHPHHPLFAALAAHDYAAGAQQLLAERQRARFPPFSYHAVLRAEAANLADALAFLAAARQAPAPPEVTLYEPVPMRLVRLKNRERAQLLVESTRRRSLQAFLAAWPPFLHAAASRRVRWLIDVDPLEL